MYLQSDHPPRQAPPRILCGFRGQDQPPLGPHLSHCPPDCPTSSTSASSKERKKLLLVAKWENVIRGSCSSNRQAPPPSPAAARRSATTRWSPAGASLTLSPLISHNRTVMRLAAAHWHDPRLALWMDAWLARACLKKKERKEGGAKRF